MSFPEPIDPGPIRPVVDGVYAVRAGFKMGPGMRISRTMTIIKTGGELALCNVARLDAAGEAELAKLGRVAHVVKLSDSHGVDEPYYVHAFKPELWTPPTSRDARVQATRRLGPESPVPGARVLHFPGSAGWAECALWIPNAGGTLISTDALQNHADTEGASFMAKLLTPMMGFKGGVIVASMWRKMQKVHGDAVRAAFAEISALSFQNLVTGHGPPVVGGADAIVRAAIDAAAR